MTDMLDKKTRYRRGNFMRREIEAELYRELMEEATREIRNHIIGFVIIAPGDVDAAIGGSGTLVSIGETKGVLTAAHVIRALRKQQEVGIVLPIGSAQRRMTFDMVYTAQSLIFGKEESEGPDLAFLKLPPDTSASLSSIMSFYNLSKQADRMLNNPPPLHDGFWGLSGYPQELTADKEPGPNTLLRVKVFRGGVGYGIVLDEEERASFDYIRYEALYNEHYEGPDRFGGVSGGGLWQIRVNLAVEKPEVREHLLTGVAFFETDKLTTREGVIRNIVCHGRKSVYGALLEKVQSGAWD